MPIAKLKVLIVTSLLFLTFASWSLGSAVGSTPDEDYVLTSIWCGTYRTALKESGELYFYRETTNLTGLLNQPQSIASMIF